VTGPPHTGHRRKFGDKIAPEHAPVTAPAANGEFRQNRAMVGDVEPRTPVLPALAIPRNAYAALIERSRQACLGQVRRHIAGKAVGIEPTAGAEQQSQAAEKDGHELDCRLPALKSGKPVTASRVDYFLEAGPGSQIVAAMKRSWSLASLK
jgi:hypothetical protein